KLTPMCGPVTSAIEPILPNTPGTAPLQNATSSLQPKQMQRAYIAELTASGGTAPYGWSVSSGALPAGMALNPATGDITGTPTAAGPSTFTVSVTDAAAIPQSASTSLSIAVAPATLQITTSSLAGGQVPSFHSSALTSSGR